MDLSTVEIFQKVVEQLPLGFVMYNPDYTILVTNKKTEELVKVSREEIVGRSFSVKDKQGTKFWFLTQIIFPSLAPQMRHVSKPGEYPRVVDISFDKPFLRLRTTTIKLDDPKGNAVGFVKLIEDKTEEALILQSKNDFVSLVSHQLRTPLTAVNWTFQLLLKEDVSDSQRKMMMTGARAANELVSRIDDTVEVAKIEDGRFDYKFKTINLVKLLKEILKRANLMAGQYDVTITADIKDEEIEIVADKHKLGVAIANLVDNALRYSPGKTVTVKLEKIKDRSQIAIKIQDTGIGIAEENRKNIFTKFFRAENARRVQPDGNGLGLFIAHNIIEAHGGNISVESVLNSGSVFTIFLPTDPKLIPALGAEMKRDA